MRNGALRLFLFTAARLVILAGFYLALKLGPALPIVIVLVGATWVSLVGVTFIEHRHKRSEPATATRLGAVGDAALVVALSLFVLAGSALWLLLATCLSVIGGYCWYRARRIPSCETTRPAPTAPKAEVAQATGHENNSSATFLALRREWTILRVGVVASWVVGISMALLGLPWYWSIGVVFGTLAILAIMSP